MMIYRQFYFINYKTMNKNFIEAGKRLVNYLENYKVAGEETKMDDEAIEILFKYLKWYPHIKVKWTDLEPYSLKELQELEEFTRLIRKLFIR